MILKEYFGQSQMEPNLSTVFKYSDFLLWFSRERNSSSSVYWQIEMDPISLLRFLLVQCSDGHAWSSALWRFDRACDRMRGILWATQADSHTLLEKKKWKELASSVELFPSRLYYYSLNVASFQVTNTSTLGRLHSYEILGFYHRTVIVIDSCWFDSFKRRNGRS